MADIKVKDLTDTQTINTDDEIMVLTNEAQNQVQNITVENLLTNVLSSDNGNVLEQGTDGKLYVETPENITGELSDLTTTEKTSLVGAINEVNSDLATEVTNRTNAVSDEATTRANADNNLQSQIDAITAASDVTDIVGTYAELQAYDTTGLPDNSIIKVLQDESRQNETTYYRWVITGGVGAWVLIGEEGPYTTIAYVDGNFVTKATIGDLNNLETSDKSSVVNAMNELASVLDPTQTADYIKNSKAIYSGEVSENALILPQIKEMAHSTFDLSKFTVVGSPSITDDGIASGFSGSKYLMIGSRYVFSNTALIELEFTPTDVINTTSNVILGNDSGDGILFRQNGTGLYMFTSINGTSWDISNYPVYTNLIAGTSYKIKFIFNGNTVSVYINGNLVFTSTRTAKLINTPQHIGVGGNGSGSIDLKQFSITVDGVEVFSGNRTGIDTIKPLNFVAQGCLYAYKYNDNIIYTNSSQDSTILYNSDGSFYTGNDWTITDGNVYYNGNQATYTSSSNINLSTQNDFVDWNESKISSDGILSGSRYPVYANRQWALTDNIIFPDFDLTTLQGKSWTISVPFNFNGNKQDSQQLLELCQNTQNFGFVNTQTHIAVGYSHIYLTIPTGSGSDKANNYNCVFISHNNLTNYLNEDLIISLSFDIQTGTYTMKLTDSNGVVQNSNWIRTFTPTTENKELQIINGTVTGGYLRAAAFYGMSIDLNGIKVIADGNLVYQPCLKIPYTESKTGSKIADSQYRNRVVDAYEQGYHQYSYYTLSDTDFTLPMGEVYGMIGWIDKLLNNEIGLPIPTLSNTLNENEIWLEGAEVSKTTYWKLYDIYGDSYGTPDSADNFVLPNFRNRTLWGADSFGYISAGLPNITGNFYPYAAIADADGAFYISAWNQRNENATGDNNAPNVSFDASRSSSIYGNSTTVQPPAIKVRYKTRYC